MKARLIHLLLLLSLCASVPAAAQILFDPPAPDTRSWVTARLFYGYGTCAVRDPEVTIGEGRIEITLLPAAAVCTQPHVETVYAQLGQLPPGVYDVTVRGVALNRSAKLVVRDARKIQVTPRGAPASGGVDVEISAITGNDVGFATGAGFPLKVQFGDGPLQQAMNTGDRLVVKVPPHAPGVVDVKLIQQTDGVQDVVVNARAAFTYYDDAQPPDLNVFEPLLFPVAYEGPGAFGSRWTTENWIFTSAIWAAYFYRPVCSGCPNPLRDSVKLPPSASPEGLVLWPARGAVPRIGATSRARDLSRQAENAGVHVPLARERDFALIHHLPDVPAGQKYRARLRLWALDDRSTEPFATSPIVRVTSFGGYRDVILEESSSGLLFASVDVTDLLNASGRDSVVVETTGGRLRHWGLVSVTNNETQQVTIIAPLRNYDASVVPGR